MLYGSAFFLPSVYFKGVGFFFTGTLTEKKNHAATVVLGNTCELFT